MRGVHFSNYEITITVPQAWRTLRERCRRLRALVVAPCEATHPELGLPCGNWPYAQDHRLYRKRHPGPHACIEQVHSGLSVSHRW